MAIKGITGALMAGPIETPQLTPFPFEQMLNAEKFKQTRGLQAMQSNMAFMDELDSMSAIPGMEDVGDYLTKPFEDEANRIIDSFGGDMSAAAVPLQNLYFDYQRTMTDDMKAHRQASAAYGKQQAALAKGVEDGTYSSKVAAATLNRSASDYKTALNNYAKGEGPRPTAGGFMRTPVAQPDFAKDFNEIIDNIKPDTYEQYGIIPVEGKPGKYTYGSSKVEYSAADARQMAAMDHIARRADYVDWAAEQYDLDLMGQKYDPSFGTILDQQRSSDPLLQPLSDDPETRARQIASVGAKDEAEFNAMAALRNKELTGNYDKQIQALRDSGMTREQADATLAESYWNQGQVEDILYDVAGMARLGAYEKRTMEDITKLGDKKKSTSSGTESDVTVPRTTRTPEYKIPTTPLESTGIRSKVKSVNEQIAEAKRKMQPNSGATDFQRQEAANDLTRLETESVNLQEQLANAEFAEALEATGFGVDDWGKDETKGAGMFEKEQAAFDAEVNKSVEQLAEQYLDRNMLLEDFGDGQGGVDYTALSKALKWAAGMGLEDANWDDRMAKAKKEAAGQSDIMLDGRRVDDILQLGRDLRDQFGRLKKADYITRTFEPFADVGANEQNRIDNRGQKYLDERMEIYIPHEVNPEDGQPINFQEKYRDAIGDMESSLRSLVVDGTAIYKNAVISPQIRATGDIINGQPAFVLDIGYYRPTPTSEPIPIRDEVMRQIMESPSGRLAALYGKGEAGRRFIVGMPDATDDVLDLADEYIEFAQDPSNSDVQRQKAAETGVQMQYNLKYGTVMQKSGVETAPSEVFVEDAQGDVRGHVSRAVDAYALYGNTDKWDNGIMRANDGTVIFDASKDQMRVEKTTFKTASGETQVSYKLYPYYGGSERGRDLANRGSGSLVTEAASIEDLIFRAFDGNSELQQILSQ